MLEYRKFLFILIGCLILLSLLIKHMIHGNEKNKLLPVISLMSTQYIVPVNTISAIGSVKAVAGVDVSPSVSGTITKIYFDSGQKVNEGDVVIELQNDDLKALVQKDKAQCALSSLQNERYTKLYNTHSISKADFDQAQSEAEQDMAQFNYDQAELDRTIIKAPFSGVLGIRQVDKGEYLPSGQVIVSLQDTSTLYVDFFISEKESDQIQLGQTVNVFSDQTKQYTWTGQVLAVESKMNESTRGLFIRAKLLPPLDNLIPGMYVKVQVLLPQQKKVMAIPQNAIVYNPYGNFVYVYKKNRVYQRYIKTGDRFGDMIVIKKGVDLSDKVVVAGQQKLFDGAEVNVARS
ncbi:MAG: efflux RND transporter periplasmic adaptor subunit [Legionellales bacterium]|nr:efflux RND transporter periplasmic adaptor subunit [Legionellales bacterium]